MNFLVTMKHGSHLYGLATKKSDTDIKGIFLPSLPELLLGNGPKTFSATTGTDSTKNTADDVDTEYFSLGRFLQLAVDGDSIALDMLHCTNPLTTSEIWEYLINHRTEFYTSRMKAYVGFAKTQLYKYSTKIERLQSVVDALATLHTLCNRVPSKEAGDLRLNDERIWPHLHQDAHCKKTVGRNNQEFYNVNGKMYQANLPVSQISTQMMGQKSNFGSRVKNSLKNQGVDWKSVSHALRVSYQVLHIYNEGDYTYPLPETEFLLAVKTGKVNFNEDVLPELESSIQRIEELSTKPNNLPKKVSRKRWDMWLLGVYSGYFGLECVKNV